MSHFIELFAFVSLGILAAFLFALAYSIFREGPGRIKKLRRDGYGVGALVSGQMPKPSEGSTIEVIEGLEFLANDGDYNSVRQTRTVSTENS